MADRELYLEKRRFIFRSGFDWPLLGTADRPWIWPLLHFGGSASQACKHMRITMKHHASLSAFAVASVISTAVMAQTTTPVTPPINTPAVSPASPAIADPFYSMQLTPANWRSTELVGKPVYSRQDERIGEIDELILSSDGRVVAAVVGVGGFLGMGERKVAISFPAMKMARDANAVTKISVDLSKESLKAAPVYTMPKTN
jgi:uncharacterized protein YrrD